MVDLGLEADDWRLEGVFVRKVDLQFEVTALGSKPLDELAPKRHIWTHSIDGLTRPIQKNLPFGHVLLFKVDLHAWRCVG